MPVLLALAMQTGANNMARNAQYYEPYFVVRNRIFCANDDDTWGSIGNRDTNNLKDNFNCDINHRIIKA
jgi:hypothetical protein